MPKSVKLIVEKLQVRMSTSENMQVSSVEGGDEENMEVESHGETMGQGDQAEQLVTPKKRTTVVGSGAGPLSTKKSSEKKKSKTPVKVGCQGAGAKMIEVVGDDGRIYKVAAPAKQDTAQVSPHSEKKKSRRKPESGETVQRKTQPRAAKLSVQEREAALAAVAVPPTIPSTRYEQFKARHPAPALRTSFKGGENVTTIRAWKQAIQDDWDCLCMAEMDVQAMLHNPRENVTLSLASRQITIASGCLHVTHFGDPHRVCVTGQFMSRGTLCCTTKKTVCLKGKAALNRDATGYERWMRPRGQFVARMKHKGGEAYIETLGPGMITGSIRLRAHYLEKFGAPGFSHHSAAIEEALAGRSASKHVEVLKSSVAEQAKRDKKLAAPHSTVTKKCAPWFWTASVPEKQWLKLEGARTIASRAAEEEEEEMEEEAVESEASEDDAESQASEESSVSQSNKKRRISDSAEKSSVTPTKSEGSTSSAKRKKASASPRTPYKLKVKLTGEELQTQPASATSETDRLLAEQTQMWPEATEAGETEEQLFESLARSDTKRKELGTKRDAAVTATAAITQQAASSGESDTSSVTRRLFTQGASSTGRIGIRAKRPPTASVSSQASFVDPNVSMGTPLMRKDGNQNVSMGIPPMRQDPKVCRVKISQCEKYSGGTPTTGLVARFDEEFFALIESTLAVPLTESEGGTEIATSILQQTVDEQLQEAEQAVQKKVQRSMLGVPAHLGDGVFKLSTSAAHINENNSYMSRPAPVPRTHLANTPDFLEADSRLHTTYGALTTQEQASRVVVNDVSLLFHLIEQQQRIVDVMEAHLELPPELTDVVSNVRQLICKAKRRTAASSVKTAIMAQYNRRWSLVDGATRTEKRVVLGKPYRGDVSVLGDPASRQNTPQRESQSNTPTRLSIRLKDSTSKPEEDYAFRVPQDDLVPMEDDHQEQAQPQQDSVKTSQQSGRMLPGFGKHKPPKWKPEETKTENVEMVELPGRGTQKFVKPKAQKPQTPEAMQTDVDAKMLQGVLEAVNSAKSGKQRVVVGTPVTPAMTEALLGEAGRNISAIEFVDSQDPRHAQLMHMPARTFITTQSARETDAALQTTLLTTQTASTRAMSPGLSQLAQQLAVAGSTSSQSLARQEVDAEKARRQKEAEVKASDSGLRSPPSRPLSPPKDDAQTTGVPYNITPRKEPMDTGMMTSTPMSATGGSETTTSDALQDLASPSGSTLSRMFHRIASSQSTGTTGPSPIPSSLNMSLSPDAKREITEAFKQMGDKKHDSTMTTQSAQSTQVLDPPMHQQGRPASRSADTPTPTLQDDAVPSTSAAKPIAKRQDSSEQMPPPATVTQDSHSTAANTATEQGQKSKREEGEVDTSMEQDEFVYDEEMAEGGCEFSETASTTSSRSKTPGVNAPVVPVFGSVFGGSERREVTTSGDSNIKVTLSTSGSKNTSPAAAPRTTLQHDPDRLESTVSSAMHAVTPASAIAEKGRRHKSRSPDSEESKRRVYPCAAARVWATSRVKDYDLVVSCLAMPGIDQKTLTELQQALVDFAAQRAAVQPGVPAVKIKTEAIEEAERQRSKELTAERRRRSEMKEEEARAILRGVRNRAKAGASPLPPGELERRLAAVRSPAEVPAQLPLDIPADLPVKPVTSVSKEALKTVATIPPRKRREGDTELPTSEDVYVDLSEEEGEITTYSEHVQGLAQAAEEHGDRDYRIYGAEPTARSTDDQPPPSQ